MLKTLGMCQQQACEMSSNEIIVRQGLHLWFDKDTVSSVHKRKHAQRQPFLRNVEATFTEHKRDRQSVPGGPSVLQLQQAASERQTRSALAGSSA